MHSVVYPIYKAYFDPANTYGDHRIIKEELREGREFDDDEFDLPGYLRSLEDLLNDGGLEEKNFALERIRFLGLKLRMDYYDTDDWYFEVQV